MNYIVFMVKEGEGRRFPYSDKYITFDKCLRLIFILIIDLGSFSQDLIASLIRIFLIKLNMPEVRNYFEHSPPR